VMVQITRGREEDRGRRGREESGGVKRRRELRRTV